MKKAHKKCTVATRGDHITCSDEPEQNYPRSPQVANIHGNDEPEQNYPRSPQVATLHGNDEPEQYYPRSPQVATLHGEPHIHLTHLDVITPNRKYPRAFFHDYNGGLYFVTVCTKDKRHIFGSIYDGKMHLSPLGVELNDQLSNISSHYADVEIPMFVVMPNHFHAIISVGSPLVATEPKIAENLGRLNQLARLTVATSGDPTLTTHHGCRLGKIVSAIKAGVTRFARRNNIEFGWLSRYHDHIIRGTRDGNMIAEYIENNVARWAQDCFYE